MKGRAWLFSAISATFRVAPDCAGAKAEAEPARRAAASAAIFTIFSVSICTCSEGSGLYTYLLQES